MLLRVLAFCLVMAAATATRAAEEFTFDASEFGKTPFEFGGYLELKHNHFRLNRDGTLYRLNFHREPRDTLDATALTFKPSGKLRRGAASLNFRAHLEGAWETRDFERTTRFDELFLSYKPDPGLTLDAGKVSLKWGKGYAWNPVAFVERAKDPNDPDLAREGFTMLSADWIRNFEGALRTVAFTPVLLPAGPDLNPDFGAGRHVNVAAKLYLLYHDTDIDLLFLASGSRSRRYGIDFSRNITSNLEVHGEAARIEDAPQTRIEPGGAAGFRRRGATSFLAGMRYLTARELTVIFEYYRNGTGLSEGDMRAFEQSVEAAHASYLATGSDAPLMRAAAVARASYARPNPGRNYFYLRLSQKEPFGILYWTPALTVIANADDRSSSVVPELLYTGITNLEVRGRAFFLGGGSGSEFGEKQNRRRFEIQTRWYF